MILVLMKFGSKNLKSIGFHFKNVIWKTSLKPHKETRGINNTTLVCGSEILLYKEGLLDIQ